jgi:hypothetical protein
MIEYGLFLLKMLIVATYLNGIFGRPVMEALDPLACPGYPLPRWKA